LDLVGCGEIGCFFPVHRLDAPRQTPDTETYHECTHALRD
jgi:hypothetical protein